MTNAQIEAKNSYLENQQNEMLERYEQVDDAEKKAIINQVNSLMPVLQGKQKEFWLNFRNKLANRNG